ncbi:hypothetical protein FJ875_09660 [Salmonella enterica]|nr:hypothetical protein [Salmonella enterica]ECA1939685.1 hypothetical protein [Salmonella enterica subsp. enterica serovar Enteritidis]ECC9068517.1 hypothetical protein [Salmonella enterica subsp. diarizonae]HCM1847991.1 hypothetical protein [Salmonella enterica subsp. diarizonae serovar 16:z10:e,n,x,z15]EBM5322912.1 hypothetical protein [Salmonella enterica]
MTGQHQLSEAEEGYKVVNNGTLQMEKMNNLPDRKRNRIREGTTPPFPDAAGLRSLPFFLPRSGGGAPLHNEQTIP